jgi:DNA repair exonuclease SbcCD ATPase subunit
MATEEQKKAAQAERDSIAIIKTEADAVKAKADAEAKIAEEDGVKKEEEVKEEEVKEPEDVEEKIEASEEKVEELEEELEDKTLTAKERERLKNRIEKERKKNRDLRKELEEANKQLAARPDDEKVFTEEEVVKRAKEFAKEEITKNEFEASVNRIAEEAKKIDKDFKTKIEAMAEDYNNGMIPGTMIGILDDLPNHGGDVLMYLTKHEDEYEEIHVLSPAKMALRLNDISNKLKKPPKPISKVPAPNEGLKGRGVTPDVLDPKNMAEFARIRAAQSEAYRKRKMGLN